MYKLNVAKRKEYITPYTKETVESLLKANNVKLDGDVGYDAVYVANMAKADFYGSSISDDMHLAKFIKDYVDDPDGYDGQPFNRWLSDIKGMHVPVDWSEFV